MPRRARLRMIPDDEPLPEPWIRHHGGECPVHPFSRPGVLFRCGANQRMGARLAKDYRWDRGNRPEPMDIVGYQDEPDDYVAPERMDLGAKVGPGWSGGVKS